MRLSPMRIVPGNARHPPSGPTTSRAGTTADGPNLEPVPESFCMSEERLLLADTLPRKFRMPSLVNVMVDMRRSATRLLGLDSDPHRQAHSARKDSGP